MGRRRFGWVQFVAVAAPATAAALAWRHLMRGFRPPNSELAVLHGLELVRGRKRVWP